MFSFNIIPELSSNIASVMNIMTTKSITTTCGAGSSRECGVNEMHVM